MLLKLFALRCTQTLSTFYATFVLEQPMFCCVLQIFGIFSFVDIGANIDPILALPQSNWNDILAFCWYALVSFIDMLLL